ncbi:fimbrial protein [Kluyvera ascorbata]|uniref:fimbrial protein n=1 Tax=Kluyvera ascorbata TaxID=51288 RepID=UPI002AB85444|nr:fimbrial protein [Kluyvera ascorbata]MDZ4034392.1 fimbrial protein [Kluyvera ascorbata]
MRVWRGILLLVGMAVCQTSWAFCSVTGSFSINPGTVVVPPDAAVGQPISDWVMSNEGVAYQNCNYDATPQYVINSGIKNTGPKASLTWNGEAVFNTNVPGVGYVFEGRSSVDSNPLPENWTGIASGQSQVFTLQISHSAGYHPSINDQARIRLIKTGDITPGALSGSPGRFIAGTRENGQWSTELPITFSGGQITTIGCVVTSPDVRVGLGQHKKAEFSGVGSATDWTVFYMSVICDKGTRVFMAVNATADSSSTPDVMKLDNDGGSATGIGVQLWSDVAGNDGPVELGKLAYYYTTLYNGPDTLKFQARYYQTAGTVTAGTANATATFTMVYR